MGLDHANFIGESDAGEAAVLSVEHPPKSSGAEVARVLCRTKEVLSLIL
jgi:hypothetical protein